MLFLFDFLYLKVCGTFFVKVSRVSHLLISRTASSFANFIHVTL